MATYCFHFLNQNSSIFFRFICSAYLSIQKIKYCMPLIYYNIFISFLRKRNESIFQTESFSRSLRLKDCRSLLVEIVERLLFDTVTHLHTHRTEMSNSFLFPEIFIICHWLEYWKHLSRWKYIFKPFYNKTPYLT